jgi:hypothetical protein
VVTEECFWLAGNLRFAVGFRIFSTREVRVNGKRGNQIRATSDFAGRVWLLRAYRVLRASFSSLIIHRVEPTWAGWDGFDFADRVAGHGGLFEKLESHTWSLAQVSEPGGHRRPVEGQVIADCFKSSRASFRTKSRGIRLQSCPRTLEVAQG